MQNYDETKQQPTVSSDAAIQPENQPNLEGVAANNVYDLRLSVMPIVEKALEGAKPNHQ